MVDSMGGDFEEPESMMSQDELEVSPDSWKAFDDENWSVYTGLYNSIEFDEFALVKKIDPNETCNHKSTMLMNSQLNDNTVFNPVQEVPSDQE